MHRMLESGEVIAKVADTVHKLSLMLRGEGKFLWLYRTSWQQQQGGAVAR